MRNRRGFALVITLIVTTLLIAVVTEFIREVYVETTLRRSYRDGEQAALMADSGIAGGVRLLRSVLAGQEYTSLNDVWKSRPLHIEDERGVLDVFIEEENGKLNLNFVAPPTGEVEGRRHYEILTRLQKWLELPADLADPLADWLDSNDMPHPGGAERAYYGGLVPPYVPRDGQLRTVEELRLVRGFSGKVFDKLRPFVTVYPDTTNSLAGEININTASREILAALDENMTDELVRRIMEYRKETPFKAKGDLAKVAGMDRVNTLLLNKNIMTKGNVFRLVATARIGETARTIEAVVRMDGTLPEFLYWREY